MEKEKISIIIPVFNGSCYIDECLNSVTYQSYDNLEIIIVNDGSTDNSLEILRKWEVNDSRIRLYNNSNHGVSYTRNYAIEKCTGEFVVCIDCDDLVAKDYVQYLYQLVKDNNADMAVVGMNILGEELKEEPEKIDVFINEDIQENLPNVIEGYIGGKIYKTNIIKNNRIKLDETIYVSEDLLFNFDYSIYCEKVIVSNKSMYFYRIQETSAFNNLFNLKWFTIIDVYDRLLEKYSKTPKLVSSLLFYRSYLLCEAKYRIKYILKNGREVPDEIKLLSERKVFLNLRFGLKNCIKLILFLLVPNLVMSYRRRFV